MHLARVYTLHHATRAVPVSCLSRRQGVAGAARMAARSNNDKRLNG